MITLRGRLIAALSLALPTLLGAANAEAECVVRPIAGTVGFRVAQQSNKTNAQAFGAVALAEETLFRSQETDLDGDGKPDRTEPFQGNFAFGMQLHNVFNVTRVPSIYQGDCFELQTGERRDFGMHSVDLYASAVAWRVRIPQLKRASFFYAGSITGSTMGLPDTDSGSFFDSLTRTRYNTSYAYGFAAIPLAFLAPLAPLINKDNPPTRLAGDFVSGLEVDLPAIGAARVGYAYSRGIFTNVSVDRIRFLVETLLTQEFSSLALIKGGFREIPITKSAGRTTLFGRRIELATPRASDATQGIVSRSLSELGFTTAHIEQTSIGKYVDLRFAYAIKPTPFVHEARIGLHGALEEGDNDQSPLRYFRANVGLVQLPALPFYGVEGGRALSFDVGFQLKTKGGGVEIGVERNAPGLLVVFPYAYDATSIFMRTSAFDVGPKEKK